MYSRSGDIVEPIIKPQWYMNCKPLAEEAIKVRRRSLFYLIDAEAQRSAPNLASSRSRPRPLSTSGIDG